MRVGDVNMKALRGRCISFQFSGLVLVGLRGGAVGKRVCGVGGGAGGGGGCRRRCWCGYPDMYRTCT